MQLNYNFSISNQGYQYILFLDSSIWLHKGMGKYNQYCNICKETYWYIGKLRIIYFCIYLIFCFGDTGIWVCIRGAIRFSLRQRCLQSNCWTPTKWWLSELRTKGVYGQVLHLRRNRGWSRLIYVNLHISVNRYTYTYIYVWVYVCVCLFNNL